MLESQLELRHKSKESFNRYRELIPDIGKLYGELPAEVYKDGILSGKTKRPMDMVAAVVVGCRGCILAQTDMALELGASADEILEACGVAISLGGTMAAAETTRVVQLLEELGKI
jgi:AhpD family alkylhydroperoxidase